MLLKFNAAVRKGKLAKPIQRSSIPCRPGCLSLHQLAQSLGNAVDARDASTYNHSEEVARISDFLARQSGLPAAEVEMIHIAAHLHDIGKIGIVDTILKKAGPLTCEERMILQQHPEIGAKIVKPVEFFCRPNGVADIILHHHERFDGSGYPAGLAGAAIPFGARIVAVADTLSAIMQHRYYRHGASFENALTEIVHCSNSQFDPAIVHLVTQFSSAIKELLTDSITNPLMALQPGFEICQVLLHDVAIGHP